MICDIGEFLARSVSDGMTDDGIDQLTEKNDLMCERCSCADST